MALLDRDIFIRNHVMGVLVCYSNKGLNYSNLSELADELTEAAIEGDRKWHHDVCCHHVDGLELAIEDVPQ